MSFVITGLSAEPYVHLYGLSDAALERQGAYRYTATTSPGLPDRVEMRDAQVGETLLLVNHASVMDTTPYKTSHAIFVLEGARHAYRAEGTVPAVMHRRLLSLRAFDAHGMMVGAQLAEGDAISSAINDLFEDRSVDRIHAHYALRGCYAGLVRRA